MDQRGWEYRVVEVAVPPGTTTHVADEPTLDAAITATLQEVQHDGWIPDGPVDVPSLSEARRIDVARHGMTTVITAIHLRVKRRPGR